MKKTIRNTLLRDFIGATFCLVMTFALLMMFSGCSEDSKSTGSLGGAEEETGIYAFKNLTGVAMRVSYEGSSDSMLVSSQLWDGYMVRIWTP